METRSTRTITSGEIAALSALVVISACCICGVLGLSLAGAFTGAVAYIFNTPQRLLQSQPETLDLYSAIRQEQDGVFHLGPECEFSDASGSAMDSSLTESDQYQRDLSPDEVRPIAQNVLRTDTYLVRDGQVRLLTGVPVNIELREGTVYLRLSEDSSTGSASWSRSIEGQVEGDIFRGQLYYNESSSQVIGGQAIERSTTLKTRFTCPLVWTEDELMP